MRQFLVRRSTRLRSLARRLGILPILGKIAAWLPRARGQDAYEERFSRAMFEALRPGDVVWDIGANVGLYSEKFADAVGPEGSVLAFEPAPACHARLVERLAGRTNTTILQMALGETESVMPMALAPSDFRGTHSLVGASTSPDTERVIDVAVAPGDLLIARDGLPAPTFVKIDVEGFEEEVIRGLREGLSSPGCRAVFCEVHFGILDAKGEREAPARIEAMFRDWGFGTSWVDASHLAAERR